jgi:hypothetical protein
MNENSRKWAQENKEHVAELRRERYAKDPEKYREKAKENRPKYAEKNRQNAREYYWEHREEKLAYYKEWFADPKNRELHAEQNRAWAQAHKEELREYCRNRSKQPLQRLNNQISHYISISLKNGKGGHHWEDLVGYTLEDLIEHIEKQFQPGMTWENRGSVWHIDHIIPKSAFHYESYDDPDFRKCWALSNLQPLWKHDNLSKNKKLPWDWRPDQYKKPRKTKA